MNSERSQRSHTPVCAPAYETLPPPPPNTPRGKRRLTRSPVSTIGCSTTCCSVHHLGQVVSVSSPAELKPNPRSPRGLRSRKGAQLRKAMVKSWHSTTTLLLRFKGSGIHVEAFWCVQSTAHFETTKNPTTSLHATFGGQRGSARSAAPTVAARKAPSP